MSTPKTAPDPERQAARRRQQFLEALDEATEDLSLEIAQLEDAVRDLRHVLAELVPVVVALVQARRSSPDPGPPEVAASPRGAPRDA